MTSNHALRILTALILAGLLAAAISLPLMEVRTLWIFSDEVTLIKIVSVLMKNDDAALGLLILGLGIVAPFGKCALLALPSLRPGSGARRAFQALNIFSSLDAFLIALAIFLMKMAEVSKPEIGVGMSFLIGFIVLSKLAEIVLLEEK